MVQAEAAACLSKASNTKVGCIILDQEKSTRSTGYNGAPRGCSADEGDSRGADKPEKYFWIEHAERNAIYNAARSGTPLKDCVLLVTHPPCMDCARAIVQVGIKIVISKVPDEKFISTWSENFERSIQLFKECGVDFYYVQDSI